MRNGVQRELGSRFTLFIRQWQKFCFYIRRTSRPLVWRYNYRFKMSTYTPEYTVFFQQVYRAYKQALWSSSKHYIFIQLIVFIFNYNTSPITSIHSHYQESSRYKQWYIHHKNIPLKDKYSTLTSTNTHLHKQLQKTKSQTYDLPFSIHVRFLEQAGVWERPLTRVVLVGLRDGVEVVLKHHSLRNTISILFFALNNLASRDLRGHTIDSTSKTHRDQELGEGKFSGGESIFFPQSGDLNYKRISSNRQWRKYCNYLLTS